jgi:hypothetical protein
VHGVGEFTRTRRVIEGPDQGARLVERRYGAWAFFNEPDPLKAPLESGVGVASPQRERG